MNRVAILFSDDQGNYYTVNCADTDDAVEAIRDKIEDAGFTTHGQVESLTKAAFNQLVK